MSTFNGYVDEFPEIRIDYFRTLAGRKAPLAAFLSHVHSDHLQGLESFRSNLIYCSPATREFLLRLEKYSHRMNFAKGILESRKQHYKHLKTILKTIPLNTPTSIELRPNVAIQVTLLDANHCAGAVMFLIEDETKAILYTGDIRSEPWWVNNLVRHPVMIPYTHGLKCLDKVYLDTTFVDKSYRHKEFPTKASGLQELIGKVLQYPSSTVFHFHAWTFGYEEVWIALSQALRSQVHVDSYKCHLYKSLSTVDAGGNPSHEGAALFGFKFGNHYQKGCLTDDQTVRLHSCEFGTSCSALDSKDTVYIIPIITRSEGRDIPEVGAGGGGGDLTQAHKLEVDYVLDVEKLVELCREKIQDDEVRSSTLKAIFKALQSENRTMSLDSLKLEDRDEKLPLRELAGLFTRLADSRADSDGRPREEIEESGKPAKKTSLPAEGSKQSLSRRIVFPYSRHSSYMELCHLLEALRPKDVYPCAVDEEDWSWEVSVENLFGHLCSGDVFAHDQKMRMREGQGRALNASRGLKRRQDTERLPRSTPPREGDVEQSQAENRPPEHISRQRPGSSYLRERWGGMSQATMISRSPLLPERPGQEETEITTSSAPSPTKTPSPVPNLCAIRSSFNQLLGSKNEPDGQTHSVSKPTQTHREFFAAPNLASGQTTSEIFETSTLKRNPSSTQAEPIELSDEDDDATCPGSEGCNSGNLPEEFPNPKTESQHSTGTQLTLSDAAFDSQGSENKTKVLRRKEAYKAAKGLSGVWRVNHGLVSSGADHGEEEIEF